MAGSESPLNHSGKSPLSVTCTGNYQIDLTHNDVILDGSPFIAKAYDPGAIVVGQISSGVVNNPVEFTSKPRHRVTSLHKTWVDSYQII